MPDAHEAVGGRQSDCIKSEFYDLLWPERALFAARDKAVHARRRKDWQVGFSPAGTLHHAASSSIGEKKTITNSVLTAIVYHEAKVLKWIDELDRQIEKRATAGSVVNATDFLSWFTFDVMGDFTFSKSFDMLEKQRWHHIVLKTQNARTLLGALTGTPWLLHIGIELMPRILWVKDWYESVEWCKAQMLERLLEGTPSGTPDLVSFFMEKNKGDEADPWLAGDSLLAILAGR